MPSRALSCALVAVVVLGVGCRERPVTNEDLARDPRQCPANEALRENETFDARVLMNEYENDASQLARRYGCRLRVVTRDRRAVAKGEPAPRVIDLEVRGGRITQIVAVGQAEDPALAP